MSSEYPATKISITIAEQRVYKAMTVAALKANMPLGSWCRDLLLAAFASKVKGQTGDAALDDAVAQMFPPIDRTGDPALHFQIKEMSGRLLEFDGLHRETKAQTLKLDAAKKEIAQINDRIVTLERDGALALSLIDTKDETIGRLNGKIAQLERSISIQPTLADNAYMTSEVKDRDDQIAIHIEAAAKQANVIKDLKAEVASLKAELDRTLILMGDLKGSNDEYERRLESALVPVSHQVQQFSELQFANVEAQLEIARLRETNAKPSCVIHHGAIRIDVHADLENPTTLFVANLLLMLTNPPKPGSAQ